MPRQLKTPIEKLKTKITNLISEDNLIKDVRQKIRVGNKVLFSYDLDIIKYTKNRYFPSKVESLVEEDFEVHFPLNSENLSLLGANISNPPRGAKLIIDLFRKNNNPRISKAIIGSRTNSITNEDLYVTKEFYETITKINKEEGKDKAVRFNNRVKPFLHSNFNITSSSQTIDRDYSLLLEEIIASGQVSQQDGLF